jgi:DNA-binding NarL/FixJ family response regulator
VETIRTYVRQILRKLGVANRTQAALKAASISLELDDPRPSAAEAV